MLKKTLTALLLVIALAIPTVNAFAATPTTTSDALIALRFEYQIDKIDLSNPSLYTPATFGPFKDAMDAALDMLTNLYTDPNLDLQTVTDMTDQLHAAWDALEFLPTQPETTSTVEAYGLASTYPPGKGYNFSDSCALPVDEPISLNVDTSSLPAGATFDWKYVDVNDASTSTTMLFSDIEAARLADIGSWTYTVQGIQNYNDTGSSVTWTPGDTGRAPFGTDVGRVVLFWCEVSVNGSLYAVSNRVAVQVIPGATTPTPPPTPTYDNIVNYDANGGTGDPPVDNRKDYQNGSSATVKGQGSLILENNNFIGWNTQADGKGTPYKEGATFQIDLNKAPYVLYAMWQPYYHVTYSLNEGQDPAGSSENINVINDQYAQAAPLYPFIENTTLPVYAYTSTSDWPIRDGYIFGGWSLDPSATSGLYITFAPNNTINIPNHDITLYAVWKKIYTVIYMPNGVDGTDSANLIYGYTDTAGPYAGGYLLGEAAPIIAIGSTTFKSTLPDGKTFQGWSTKMYGTPQYSFSGAGSTLTQIDISSANITGDYVILYAIYS